MRVLHSSAPGKKTSHRFGPSAVWVKLLALSGAAVFLPVNIVTNSLTLTGEGGAKMKTAVPRLSDEQKEILVWLLKKSVLIERRAYSRNWNSFCPHSKFVGCRAGVYWDFAKGHMGVVNRRWQHIPKDGPHRSSVSRSLRRLRLRGLVETENSNSESVQTYHVTLTDIGRAISIELAEQQLGENWLDKHCQKHDVTVHYSEDHERKPGEPDCIMSGHYEVTNADVGTFTDVTGQHCDPLVEVLTATDEQIADWVDGQVDQFKSLLVEHATKTRDEGKAKNQFVIELEVSMAEIVEEVISPMRF